VGAFDIMAEQQTSMFVKLLLALLVIALIIQISTGDLFGFISHNIDKILTPTDRDGPGDRYGQITGLVNLANFASDFSKDLEPLIYDEKEYCLHRINSFDDSLFKDYSLSITSSGTPRISIISGFQEISYKELGSQITLCAIHGDSADTLKNLIRNQNIDLSTMGADINPTSSLIFSAKEVGRLSRFANVSLTLNNGDELSFQNINYNEHIYFLKFNDHMCIIPVSIKPYFNIRRDRCNVEYDVLHYGCIDGVRTNDLKRLYEQNEHIRCEGNTNQVSEEIQNE
jgi:hypothetical protein